MAGFFRSFATATKTNDRLGASAPGRSPQGPRTRRLCLQGPAGLSVLRLTPFEAPCGLSRFEGSTFAGARDDPLQRRIGSILLGRSFLLRLAGFLALALLSLGHGSLLTW